jgi:hypothetical protein
MTDIPIILAVEDALSEAVLKEMLKQSKRPFFRYGTCLNRGGYGYIKKIISRTESWRKGNCRI